MSQCKIDGQPNHWFRCSRGTTGCPRCHDGRTPHCIVCTAGEPCPYHDEPNLEMSVEEFIALDPEHRAYLRTSVA